MHDMRKLLNAMSEYNGWYLTDEQIGEILTSSKTESDDATLYKLIHNARLSNPELDAIRERCEAMPNVRWEDIVAHARTDIPALLDEIERLKAENAELKKQTEVKG